ncbi:U5 snRNP-associated RNA splicing factor-like protein [Dinothrombium tinctorium]|uniref:Pre-mRNA-splicing factor 18 n=1 Tax=Dinothrombium tinctorium TaxID=1965070 RepID=A0A3S3P8M6_9ACAR|nr:U5 snRNP-associated RNA splicing factor-like protein [Dinothrombium tinctorium]
MDVLKAEIERKRKLLESNSLITNERKFFKREALIQKHDQEYWERNKLLYTGGVDADDRPQNGEESNHSIATVKIDKVDERILPRKEVIRRLRERGEPILLFGETESESFARLRHLEIAEPEFNRGFRNDFQEAMEKVDQDFLQEILQSGGSNDGDTKQKMNDVKVEDMHTNLDEIKKSAVNLGKKKDESTNDCQIIYTFIKYLMELWGKKLNSRPETQKMTTQGKIASATYTQTQTYLKPLFKQLKSNKVAEDILKHLILISRYLLERDYVKANDAYLKMAIGNAPWPIGVTMVGIHARTGREKIFSQNIAHVLNDENQRKYIQGLKRLITQCQRLFPTDPSRSVEFNAIKDD